MSWDFVPCKPHKMMIWSMYMLNFDVWSCYSRNRAYGRKDHFCLSIYSFTNGIRFLCRQEQSLIRWLSLLGVTSKQMETEVSIMRKLVYHKNVLQLLDWNTAEGKSSIRRGLFLVYQVILLLHSMCRTQRFSSNPNTTLLRFIFLHLEWMW